VSGILSLKSDEINQKYPIQSVSCGNNFLFVPLKNLTAVHKTSIRMELLKAAGMHLDSTELFVFTAETVYNTSDFHCRMFAPLFGVPEDPATGSAAGPFGCYLVQNDICEGSQIIIEQGLEMSRPSILKVHIEGKKDDITRVQVSGDVVLVSEGNLFI
jgi:trans-2,3-dihydro-3-hydroxyanthranilate isomerase